MSIIPMIHDENEFLLLRQQLLDETTVTQDRRAAHVTKNIDYNNIPTSTDPSIREKLLKRKERNNSILLHHAHEKRFSHYKQAFNRIWDDTFHNTPIQTTTLIVGSRNNPSISKELVRRSPFPKKHIQQQTTKQPIIQPKSDCPCFIHPIMSNLIHINHFF
ncbi:unnamed protein product [Adineta ricciae]|uniref:Uncharacterized protein n=1 Tax=Adineta ricciae TaxID=249248 RepID=A0A814YS86_ADIRI|nr:unnamed protein product [Adineta ricciae]CAF1233965.1 unnamed protein product [Adineta ricciae]